jgi:hypothetical protein
VEVRELAEGWPAQQRHLKKELDASGTQHISGDAGGWAEKLSRGDVGPVEGVAAVSSAAP